MSDVRYGWPKAGHNMKPHRSNRPIKTWNKQDWEDHRKAGDEISRAVLPFVGSIGWLVHMAIDGDKS